VLLEAMAAGCVPVASQLAGITDWIVDDGESGFVVPPGDAHVFAGRIRRLHEDRRMLELMSRRSRETAESRFSREAMIKGYLEVFQSLLAEPPPEWEPLSLTRFELDREFQTPGWKRGVPAPLRVLLKRTLYHLGLSDRYE
jgi:hypothetical protein